MPPPLIGSDTLQSRAAASGQIFEQRQAARERAVESLDTVAREQDVPIRRRDGGGFGPGEGFLDRVLPREAARDLDPQFPRQDIGPADVRETGEGFRPTEGVRRRSAAFEFEEQTPLDDVDPQRDVQPREGAPGFGLAPQAERRAAAAELDPQLPAVDVGAGDVQRTDEGFAPLPGVRRQQAAAELDPQFPAVDIGPGQLERVDQGFRPQPDVQRQQAAAELDPQFPLVDLGAADVEREGADAFGLTSEAEREIGAARLEEQTPLDEVTPSDVERTDEGFSLRESVIENNRGVFF